MRVVVTGGAGYIGSVVTEALLANGHDVLVIDNLVKGHRDSVPDEARFAPLDLRDRERVTTALKDFHADAVIHMAAYSLVGESVSAPGKYYDNNLGAGLALLEAMRDAGVQKIVFSSTAAVYGEPAKQPIEEHDPTAPSNPYGETKLAFERALRWHAAAHDLRSISLRYFNAAGASRRNGERHDPETHLVPLVLQAAAGSRPRITIFGDDYPTRDGTCVRDYIHVEDLADAHVRALEPLAHAGTCDAYNLGCGGFGYTVKEIIDAASSITGRTIPVEVAPRRAGDPAALIASSARIARDLGWAPRQSLTAIITSAWNWMHGVRDRRAGTIPATRFDGGPMNHKQTGISNRESASEEAQERREHPPTTPDAPPPAQDAAGREGGDQLTDTSDSQMSHKAGSRSVAQKEAESKYADRGHPASHKVAGASGKEA